MPNFNAPDWVDGCEKCHNGLINPPPLTGNDALFMERLAQATTGRLTFCTCRAGHMYRQNMRRHYSRLMEQTAASTSIGTTLLQQAIKRCGLSEDDAQNRSQTT